MLIMRDQHDAAAALLAPVVTSAHVGPAAEEAARLLDMARNRRRFGDEPGRGPKNDEEDEDEAGRDEE
jgi:hypothetical protein